MSTHRLLGIDSHVRFTVTFAMAGAKDEIKFARAYTAPVSHSVCLSSLGLTIVALSVQVRPQRWLLVELDVDPSTSIWALWNFIYSSSCSALRAPIVIP